MLGENGTVRNKGGKRYINPTHLVILTRHDKIKSVLLAILYYDQRTKKDSEFWIWYRGTQAHDGLV